MNIGEHFYCSRCLKELKDESVCDECHYDPAGEPVENALEEGTLLGNGRIQIGAVRRHCQLGFIYGAYDYLKQKPVFVFEFFPEKHCTRSLTDGTEVTVLPGHEPEYNKAIQYLKQAAEMFDSVIEENNTVYAIDWIEAKLAIKAMLSNFRQGRITSEARKNTQ